jgi:G protein-coupled receptor family C group 5 protein B
MGDHEPRNYFMYDEDTGEKVYNWPVWAITVAVLTCVGLLCGLILFFYFLIFYPIRGGTTILGFLMMLGLFGVYAINFAFFKPAAKDTCGVREFLQGVVYAVVIAPLFVKAVDNWRFKDSEYSPKRYVGLTHPVSLVLIALCIVAVQCIIPIEWLILRNPSASIMANSTNRHDWMWCDPHDFYDVSLILSMSYVVFLIILTSIFSALAWDSESNYYESRWIFVSCVCTAGCFLVWMVVSTNAGPPFRDPAVAIANFVNATAILIFIPFRKFILLIQFSSEEEEAKSMPADEARK